MEGSASQPSSFDKGTGKAVLVGGWVLPRRQGEAVRWGCGPSCHAVGGGAIQVRMEEGSTPQLPAAPALVGESVVEQAPPVGPSAIAPWG